MKAESLRILTRLLSRPGLVTGADARCVSLHSLLLWRCSRRDYADGHANKRRPPLISNGPA